jgi:hypothetical protein
MEMLVTVRRKVGQAVGVAREVDVWMVVDVAMAEARWVSVEVVVVEMMEVRVDVVSRVVVVVRVSVVVRFVIEVWKFVMGWVRSCVVVAFAVLVVEMTSVGVVVEILVRVM